MSTSTSPADGVISRTADSGQPEKLCLTCNTFRPESEYTPSSWRAHGSFKTSRGACRTRCRSCQRTYDREKHAKLRAALRYCVEHNVDLSPKCRGSVE
jgi:hypothetical protein